MVRAFKPTGKPNGRPQKHIDWNVVDEWLEAEAVGTSIANHFGIHPSTLYERCIMEKGMGFTEYSQLKKIDGDTNLKKKQYDKALGKTEKGDNTLLIFLGKARLKQRETHPENNVDPESEKTYQSFMNSLRETQFPKQKNEETKSPDMGS